MARMMAEESKVVESKPAPVQMKERKRVDRFGQLVIDRDLQPYPAWYPFECNKLPQTASLKLVSRQGSLMQIRLNKSSF
jgi:hypothetical protein